MLLDALEMMFSGRSEAPPGQVIITPTALTMTWIVPQDVYEISAVAIGLGTSGAQLVTSLSRGATVLLSTTSALGAGIGGGNGGNGGTGDGASTGAASGGGGGAGGYAGNGGVGGSYTSYNGTNGSAGQGGGGGGGRGASLYGDSLQRTSGSGGGVGLLGQGANGGGGYGQAGNIDEAQGGNGSPPAVGRTYGAGNKGSQNGGSGGKGGNLRWRNAIPVTPGETLNIAFPVQGLSAAPFGTAIRIIWGGGRSFPLNAGDM